MIAQMQTGGNVALITLYITLTMVFVIVGTIATLALVYRRTSQGKVWVRTGLGGVKISFDGIICLPILHQLEALDITAQKIELRHFRESALRTKDNVPMNAQVGIVLRVPPTAEGVFNVVQTHGCEKASDPAKIEEMFRDRFEEALTASLRQFTWQEIETSFEPLKEEFRRRVGTDLLGFVMEDVSFGHLAKPVEAADLVNQPDRGQVSKN